MQKLFRFWHRGDSLREDRGGAYCTAGFPAYAGAELDPAREYLEAGSRLLEPSTSA